VSFLVTGEYMNKRTKLLTGAFTALTLITGGTLMALPDDPKPVQSVQTQQEPTDEAQAVETTVPEATPVATAPVVKPKVVDTCPADKATALAPIQEALNLEKTQLANVPESAKAKGLVFYKSNVRNETAYWQKEIAVQEANLSATSARFGC
jgi:hypothetical protein